VLAAAVVLATGEAQASLADRLHAFIAENAFITTNVIPDTYTPIIERLAARGTDFPAAASSPTFTFELDPETGAFVRSSRSLGPIFTERADTIGRHGLAIGAAYLYGNLTDRDGDPLLLSIHVQSSRPGQDIRTTLDFTDFQLRTSEVQLFATFGLTDRWDVNVLLPVIDTTLEVAADQTGSLNGNQLVNEHLHLEDSAAGVGDLILRTKYRLFESLPIRLASELALRLPTGSVGDFHGIGDVTVTPGLVASWPYGRQDVHAAVGMEADATELDKSRVRYAIGTALTRWDSLAFLVDLIGSSSVTRDEFEITVPLSLQNIQNPDIISHRETPNGTVFTAAVPRSDIIDMAFGVKWNCFRTGILFASVFVPITNDGLRAAVIPSGGFEYTF
jgi:hypothetical protein